MKPRKGTRRINLIMRSLLLLAFLGLSLIGCKSPMSPKGGEADLIIFNEYSDTLDIYINDSFRFAILKNSNVEVDNIPLGTYKVEAKIAGTDIVIASETIEILEKIDYNWMIDDPPDINVTNSIGDDVTVYMDDNYQFDLAHGEDRWIIDVPFGKHFLKAIRVRDATQIASTTINVAENIDYSWTIEIITNY